MWYNTVCIGYFAVDLSVTKMGQLNPWYPFLIGWASIWFLHLGLTLFTYFTHFQTIGNILNIWKISPVYLLLTVGGHCSLVGTKFMWNKIAKIVSKLLQKLIAKFKLRPHNNGYTLSKLFIFYIVKYESVNIFSA